MDAKMPYARGVGEEAAAVICNLPRNTTDMIHELLLGSRDFELHYLERNRDVKKSGCTWFFMILVIYILATLGTKVSSSATL